MPEKYRQGVWFITLYVAGVILLATIATALKAAIALL